jgi:hypothetical protein
MLAFLCKEHESAPGYTEVRNKKDLETTLRAFENNINQIIEDDLFMHSKVSS